ncbi:winged helix-turn-helix domain-containing protein [Actinomadura opuntiae]|uniref:winged helix-turn-helix domain-containing protein n=1 Tax=Actinomadura sp. OS1-43 TaxID=604315 RepID=UPI00255A9AEB|nr:winged helix-turn-helix domain-containing protein [Actinomadura sp. OS1-43]MDL4816834.1 winged helix-turn-helix domain-containing protein [Actinomadura sp. OS1-43]
MVELDGIDPLKVQIADLVARRIESGEYAPKARIPSASALAEECGVSQRTAADAVRILKERGLVRGVPGRGVFVLPGDER